jgi:hypothetical protein
LIDIRKVTGSSWLHLVTGTTATLLNGSIYHSVLGISDGEFISADTLTQIRARLDDVDYIFLDEISMVSRCDLYSISSQATKARRVLDEPFGRITIIFSGDFAQLPPVRSGLSTEFGQCKHLDEYSAAIVATAVFYWQGFVASGHNCYHSSLSGGALTLNSAWDCSKEKQRMNLTIYRHGY